MDTLTILPYGGILALVVLLVVFELTNAQQRNEMPRNEYEFITSAGNCVLVRHVLGTIYKVYTSEDCPVATKTDRYGRYFTVKARSASEAEHIIDELYGS